MNVLHAIGAGLQWAVNHAGDIAVVVGVLIGAGVIKDRRVIKLYDAAVHVAEQWKKANAKCGLVVNGETVKAQAIAYLERKGVSAVDLEKLEEAVARMNAKK